MRTDRLIIHLSLTTLVLGAVFVSSQGPPPMRKHTTTRAGKVQLQPANKKPGAANEVSITKVGDVRKVKSNAIPAHLVGAFPNRGNPNSIRPQALQIELPANPKPAPRITYIHGRSRFPRGGPLRFGIGLNGVLFDPGAAEFFMGDPSLGWQYEALSGAVPLGLDENFAHVQPTGAYHYHGIPAGLIKRLGFAESKHSPLVGWAADGFPVYAIQGYENPEDPNSKIVELKPSYRLKKGNRPGGDREPGGKYDGAFVKDYEFVKGSGDLDECNGRFGVTPDFPKGTYAYFLTREWPIIPRAFRGTPVSLGVEFGNGRRPPPGKGFKGKGPKGKGPKRF